jgi:glutathione S-transferase
MMVNPRLPHGRISSYSCEQRCRLVKAATLFLHGQPAVERRSAKHDLTTGRPTGSMHCVGESADPISKDSPMTSRFTLHGIWLSGPAYKVGLMLSLAGEQFDYVHVNLRGGEHKQPEFLSKQRFGQVPLLEDSKTGLKLTQSASILCYLAEQLGKFGGASPQEAIAAREWMFWDFDRLAMHVYRMRGQRLGIRSMAQPTAEMHVADGQAALKVLDDHLAGRGWIVGDGPTIADIDIYGVIAYAPAGGFNLAAYPGISAWKARFETLPGFKPNDQLLPKQTQAA